MLDPALFGKHPAGSAIDPASLCVQAPAVVEVRLPAELVEGCEFVTAGMLHPAAAAEGSVQLQVLPNRVEPSGLQPAQSVIVGDSGSARQRFEAAFDDMRDLFPAALCYAQIVPVDEVITLNLFYREDDHLRRLMLDERQAAELDRHVGRTVLRELRSRCCWLAAFEQLYRVRHAGPAGQGDRVHAAEGPIAERAAGSASG